MPNNISQLAIGMDKIKLIKFSYETNQTVSELKMITITERQGLTVEQVTHVDWNLNDFNQ